jgi:hypothetical protein
LRNLEFDAEEPMKLIGVRYSLGRLDENAIHILLDEDRHHGEWFNPTERVKKTVREIILFGINRKVSDKEKEETHAFLAGKQKSLKIQEWTNLKSLILSGRIKGLPEDFDRIGLSK